MQNDRFTTALEGRITSQNAGEWQDRLRRIQNENPGKEMILDAENLDYISSAGLRVLLTLTKRQNGKLTVRNVSPEVFEIFEMTGFTDLMKVEKRMRRISVDGCEVVGWGAIGTVYRIDEDTIVKVYEIPDSLPMIENEQRRAKQAFLKGIPTAISYDVVRVGDKYGSVFEMLRASTYNDLLIAHPEQLEELTRRYAYFVRDLHAVKMEPGELPSMNDVYKGYLADLKPVLPEALHARLCELFGAMPENLHVLHGDIQMKNVMVSEGELLLIDMDTLSVGDPVYELAALFMGYIAFCEDDPGDSDRFLGISLDMCNRVWECMLRYYFDDRSIPADAEQRIKTVGYVRFLYLIAALGIGLPELRDIRIEHTIRNLEALCGQVQDLRIAAEP